MRKEKVETEYFLTQRGFGKMIGFGKRPALLVIDFIRAFTNPDLPLGSSLDSELAETNRILEVMRTKALPIFFTSVVYEDLNQQDNGIWHLKMEGLSTLKVGTPEVEIDLILNPGINEPIIVKKYASAFCRCLTC